MLGVSFSSKRHIIKWRNLYFKFYFVIIIDAFNNTVKVILSIRETGWSSLGVGAPGKRYVIYPLTPFPRFIKALKDYQTRGFRGSTQALSFEKEIAGGYTRDRRVEVHRCTKIPRSTRALFRTGSSLTGHQVKFLWSLAFFFCTAIYEQVPFLLS